MQSGKLRHRVTVEQFVTELDTDGENVGGWIPVFDRPISAEIHPMSGRELIAADASQSKVDTRITVRFRTELKATMRVLHRIHDLQRRGRDPGPGQRDQIRYAALLVRTE